MYTAKNYSTDGGDTLVIGGKLEINEKATIEGVVVHRHYNIPAASAPAASSDGVHAAMNLSAAVQEITTGITNPAVPRNMRVDGNVLGINGKVKITGTNYNDEVISEEIQANGTTAVDGTKAFKTVTKIELPIQNHTPAKQKATIAVTSGAEAAGESVLEFTAAALGEDSPKEITVTLTADDNTAAETAAKIAEALNADDDFTAHFVAASADANVTIESKVFAAQDSTLNLTVKTAGDPNIAVDAIDVDTVPGVPVDTISVGWGDKFGLPFKLYADELVTIKLFGKSADTGTVTANEDELEKNVFDPNGTPDGANQIDLYIMV